MAADTPDSNTGRPNTSDGSIHPITPIGAPVLHRSCAPVTVFDKQLAELIEDMFASMYAARGVGLAANQIGIDARVLVMDCPDLDTGERTTAHLVNPVLELPEAPARTSGP